MIKREDYESVVSTLFMEFQGTMGALTDELLAKTPAFVTEIQEIKSVLQDPNVTNSNFVGYCFGVIDEYLRHHWDKSISEGYDLYRDLNRGK